MAVTEGYITGWQGALQFFVTFSYPLYTLYDLCGFYDFVTFNCNTTFFAMLQICLLIMIILNTFPHMCISSRGRRLGFCSIYSIQTKSIVENGLPHKLLNEARGGVRGGTRGL